MALFSNTLQVIRHYLSSAVGDLIYGQCGTTGATTSKIYAPFLWQPGTATSDYYSDHFFEVYVYDGKNIGETRRVKSWVLLTYLLEVHSAYDAACDATSHIELHHIFTEDELRKAINLAIESLAGKYLIDIKDETTVLVADTYEYELPLSMLYIYRITTEYEAGGGKFYNNAIIDPRDWSIIKSYPPKLKLDKSHYGITAGKDLRIEGQGTQPIVDDDTDLIYLPPDWLVQKAITFLPQNKIQSNDLDENYRRAERFVRDNPIRTWPNPRAQRVVE